MRIKSYNDFNILNEEKSIGSENIRTKYYSDIDKSTFYKIINIDPTSVRKKDFSKPGKYSKWLLREYRKLKANKNNKLIDSLLSVDTSIKKDLNMKLFIYSTNWFKSQQNDGFYSGGTFFRSASNEETDILKYSLEGFIKMMNNWTDKYKEETANAEFETVFSDDKVSILIPLNFTASYETAKNTEWCSKSYSGYSIWNKSSLLFRIIPEDKSKDKIKLTWTKDDKKWYIACSKYPEMTGVGNPFDIIDGKEKWLITKEKYDKIYNDEYSESKKWRDNSIKIAETMQLLTPESKKLIKLYYDKNKKI